MLASFAPGMRMAPLVGTWLREVERLPEQLLLAQRGDTGLLQLTRVMAEPPAADRRPAVRQR